MSSQGKKAPKRPKDLMRDRRNRALQPKSHLAALCAVGLTLRRARLVCGTPIVAGLANQALAGDDPATRTSDTFTCAARAPTMVGTPSVAALSAQTFGLPRGRCVRSNDEHERKGFCCHPHGVPFPLLLVREPKCPTAHRLSRDANSMMGCPHQEGIDHGGAPPATGGAQACTLGS